MSLKQDIIWLHNQGKSYDEISNKLNCTKGVISYYLKHLPNNKRPKIPTNVDKDHMQDIYNDLLSIRKTAKETGWSETTIKKYVKTSNKNVSKKITNEDKKERNVKKVHEKRKRIKKELVDYKGGACQCCGYNKCIDVFEFHHINPKNKEFGLGMKGLTKAMHKMKEEADKCLLVCANCHREIHAGLIDVNDFV